MKSTTQSIAEGDYLPMPAPQAILDLVARFEEHKDAYHAGSYSESELRTEFIDPFFEVMGWDIANKNNKAPQYKDVLREASVAVEGQAKKPDYEFRIGGVRKFYVEAKKPSVNLKSDVGPAFQIRRYAWSAKLPLGILTDFEEMSVYDCRNKPKATDSAGTGRVFYYKYTDYADKWDEIAGIFSIDGITHGAFDKFAISDKKRGTETVDKAFLNEMESWREILAKNIALRNGQLTVEELNHAVQLTIDRIIFLRICEDRGIESYGELQKLAAGKEVYTALLKHFLYADERYNSGLFHFKKEPDNAETPDDLTPSLKIDDKVLKDIIKRLYYPECPYEFSVISADILGQVYERFLGKVIRLTTGHQAKVEDKPEVKKAGGVYYTPTYIVDYIVKNTVGKLVEGKTPAQVDKLKVLDPACGSGSFLIGAYQFLLDWYLEYYSTHDPAKLTKGKNPKLNQAEGGGWKLTLPERRRILLNNIHGVDIDGQAIEVTKLSLLLKVLESETQQRLFDKRVLPDLSANIKCGNSLIGTDYFADKLIVDPDEMRRINAFDWETEFPGIISVRGSGATRELTGGFDAVVGNPPYVRLQTYRLSGSRETPYIKSRYVAARAGNFDVYAVFIEQGLDLLNARGRLGYIVPHKFTNARYGEGIREVIASGSHLSKLVYFGDQQVFQGASTYTCLLFLEKRAVKEFLLVKVKDLADWQASGASRTTRMPTSLIGRSEWLLSSGEESLLLDKIKKQSAPLGEVASFFVGLQTSADKVFLFKNFSEGRRLKVSSQALGEEVYVEEEIVKPVIRSGQIGRYWASSTALVLFPYELIADRAELIPQNRMRQEYPFAWAYLNANKSMLCEREHGKFAGNGWYQLYPKNLDSWEQPKIMIPYMTKRLAAYFDVTRQYFVNVTTGGFGLVIKNKACSELYLTALLNSKLLDWAFRQVASTFRGGYYSANKQFLVTLPIRILTESDAHHVTVNNLADLAKKMQDLYLDSKVPKTIRQETAINRQIDATDRQIDQLVYELYGLTDEEIKTVEGDI